MARQSNLAIKTETQVEDKFVDTTNGKYDDAAANAVTAPTHLSEAPALMPKQTDELMAIVTSTATKSDKIRRLLALGEKRGSVAKLLGIKYQHVRNVEITPIKRTA